MGVRASKLSKFIAPNKYKALSSWPPSPSTPRGYVPIAVGISKETSKRFIVHTKVLVDTDFQTFLHRSAEEYGFHNEGIIRIPYEAKAFEEWIMVKGPKQNVSRIRGT